MQHGQLYKIDARNSSVGVWSDKEKAFIIHRYKWYEARLDEELHYDSDEKHGTATPFEVLPEAIPDAMFEMEDVLLDWLWKMEQKYNHDQYYSPEDPK